MLISSYIIIMEHNKHKVYVAGKYSLNGKNRRLLSKIVRIIEYYVHKT